jgi:hypothetical protein
MPPPPPHTHTEDEDRRPKALASGLWPGACTRTSAHWLSGHRSDIRFVSKKPRVSSVREHESKNSHCFQDTFIQQMLVQQILCESSRLSQHCTSKDQHGTCKHAVVAFIRGLSP